MCPLKDQCSKVKMQRWPSSGLKSITKFGKDCPYAHHPMELQFPETLNMRLKANKKKFKEHDTPWTHASPLLNCGGCSRCSLCKYKLDAAKTLGQKSNFKVDEDEIKKRKEETDKNVDNFKKKFGMLKKASVLLFYGRVNDAFDEIAKAAHIVREQREIDKENELNL